MSRRNEKDAERFRLLLHEARLFARHTADARAAELLVSLANEAHALRSVLDLIISTARPATAEEGGPGVVVELHTGAVAAAHRVCSEVVAAEPAPEGKPGKDLYATLDTSGPQQSPSAPTEGE